MQVQGPTSRYPTLLPLDGAESSGEGGSLQETLMPHIPSATGATSQFREILAKYDIHNITPRDFSDMVTNLYESGEINLNEYRELSQIRLELDTAGADPEEPLDLLEFFQDKLSSLGKKIELLKEEEGSSADQLQQSSSLEMAKRQLNWLEKFSLVQAEDSTEALNALV